MSTGRPRADQAPIASTDRLLHEALRTALLRSLCHKMHSLWDRQQQYTPAFRRWDRADLLAEMIGDMVGLKLDAVYQAFDDGDCTGAGLIEQLEPLLARARGSWMTEGLPVMPAAAADKDCPEDGPEPAEDGRTSLGEEPLGGSSTRRRTDQDTRPGGGVTIPDLD